MLILITLLIASSASHRVTESIEDLPPEAFNTTALFPVGNRTNTTDRTSNATDADSKGSQQQTLEATTWKLESAFGESKLDDKESEQDDKDPTTTSSPPQNKTKTASSEFRPSPALGSFFEDYGLEITPTRATLGDFRPLKKPPTAFVSFPKDNFKSSFYKPKDPKNQFPYKMEPIVTRAKTPWRDALESKPTVEAPMRVPAGSFYKAPEAFKKPGSDEDFGLTFDDLKENNNVDIKKRVNPWKNLLRLVTAFIPVGLIISALTPNIITVQSTDPGPGYPPPHIFRRSDKLSELQAISEPCRRRLLCELHSDNNYDQSADFYRSRRRQCHRIRCEETDALGRMLEWLLSHRPGDQRGRYFT